MAHAVLSDAEQKLPRRIRRALLADRRRTVKKHTPFGRVKVLDLESGVEPQDDRVVYRHFTKGVMDRRTTFPLLDNLISIG
ncbi:MAG: hypothetical protein AAGA71_12850 [Pseudomonadota bacterium]